MEHVGQEQVEEHGVKDTVPGAIIPAMGLDDRPAVRFCSSADGVRIAYARSGRGPVLVKAAHWLTHLEHDARSPIWRPWIEGFTRRFEYVRYDTRGCGLSDREPARLDLDAWVEDLEAVVDDAGLERFTLLGISQGGSIAIAYAERHPERVERLVLYGAFARGRLRRGASSQKEEDARLQCQIVEHSWGGDNPGFRNFFAATFMPDAPRELLEAFAELQRVTSTPAHAARQMQVSHEVDVTALAGRIACPTLVMHGQDDARVPFEEGRLIAALIPGARFLALPTPNHVMRGDEPAFAEFLAALEAFIPRAGPTADFGSLTARERELVELLARGLDNHQIAAHLRVSEKTVRNHVSAILAKLGVDSRGRAIVLARESGFGAGVGPA